MIYQHSGTPVTSLNLRFSVIKGQISKRARK